MCYPFMYQIDLRAVPNEDHHPLHTQRDERARTIENRVETCGHADLHEAMGGKGRVSEVFPSRRRLSVDQIRALSDPLDIAADLLIA